MITLAEAKALKHGTILYVKDVKNADGTPQRWRVSGKVKTWKQDESRFRVPIKHGLYENWALEAQWQLNIMCLTESEASA